MSEEKRPARHQTPPVPPAVAVVAGAQKILLRPATAVLPAPSCQLPPSPLHAAAGVTSSPAAAPRLRPQTASPTPPAPQGPPPRPRTPPPPRPPRTHPHPPPHPPPPEAPSGLRTLVPAPRHRRARRVGGGRSRSGHRRTRPRRRRRRPAQPALGQAQPIVTVPLQHGEASEAKKHRAAGAGLWRVSFARCSARLRVVVASGEGGGRRRRCAERLCNGRDACWE